MKETLTRQERAAIYEAAWRVYCATCSEDYTKYKAQAVGDKLDIAPIRTAEIIREAIETIQRKQREATKQFLDEAPKYVERYIKQFPAMPGQY